MALKLVDLGHLSGRGSMATGHIHEIAFTKWSTAQVKIPTFRFPSWPKGQWCSQIKTMGPVAHFEGLLSHFRNELLRSSNFVTKMRK